jgi:hypothetical protein
MPFSAELTLPESNGPRIVARWSFANCRRATPSSSTATCSTPPTRFQEVRLKKSEKNIRGANVMITSLTNFVPKISGFLRKQYNEQM